MAMSCVGLSQPPSVLEAFRWIFLSPPVPDFSWNFFVFVDLELSALVHRVLLLAEPVG